MSPEGEKTLLLLDDDAPFRQRMGRALEQRGYRRISARRQSTYLRELLLVADLLVVEHQHGVRVHSGMDRGHVVRG